MFIRCISSIYIYIFGRKKDGKQESKVQGNVL
jgi:hypothetical protein